MANDNMRKFTKKQIILIGIIIVILISITMIITFSTKSNDNIRRAIWVNGDDMEDVNLDTLSKYDIENIFLHSSAVDKFGTKTVSEWINKAKNRNIKVHIWVQCFYNGSWVNPINTKQKDFNYPYFNAKLKEIEKYTTINNISGIQLDYIRYPGDAYKYSYSDDITATNAVSKFVSMVNPKVKNKNLTLSITVMPEKEDNIRFYGQDTKELSKYVDVIVPMVYAGNYNKSSEWIYETTKYFKENSGDANVCIGIQDYVSDYNLTALTENQLKKHYQAALNGGADGVALFNWKLMKNWFYLRNIM
jgi:hypothetical protein